MARYYVLTIEPTLFGDIALVREWGRIGCSCRRRLDLFADPESARVALDIWLARKKRKGYILRHEGGCAASTAAVNQLTTSTVETHVDCGSQQIQPPADSVEG